MHTSAHRALFVSMMVALVFAGPAWAQLAVEDMDTKLRGRVVDENGKPIADVHLSAGAPGAGELMWLAQISAVRARSDAEGRFELALPFREVLYSVHVQRMGYSGHSLTIVPDAAGLMEPVTITLTREKHTPLRGRISGPDGNFVSNLTITLVGEYGYSATTRTLVDGTYRFELPRYIGQAVLVAERGDLAIAQEIVRAPERAEGKQFDATLVEAGRLEGVVTDRVDKKPVAHAEVTIRPWFSSGFSMRARCNAEGKYVIDSVPPGQYLVEATAPVHFDKPPRGISHDRERVEMKAGQTATHNIVMGRSAVVRGRVVDRDGRPVANAAVGMRTEWWGDYRNQNRYVRTNNRGEFEIVTGHVDSDTVYLAAFSARGGLRTQELANLNEGEERNDVKVTLPGAVRVRGIVTDDAGKPVRDVVCAGGMYGVNATTDADGKFDLGWLTLPVDEKAKMELAVRSPRPAFVNGIFSADAGKVDPKAQVYFEDKTVPLQEDKTFATSALHGKELDLKIALKPTDLLTIDGGVTDAKGEPAKDVRLYLFAGNAKDETWKEQVLPSNHNRFIAITDKLITNATTDAKGRFTLRAVRFDGEATATGTRYSIGIVADNKAVKLVKDVVLPADGKQREVLIKLD